MTLGVPAWDVSSPCQVLLEHLTPTQNAPGALRVVIEALPASKGSLSLRTFVCVSCAVLERPQKWGHTCDNLNSPAFIMQGRS